LLAVFNSWFEPQIDIWAHLVDTVLTDYIVNSLLLTVGVGIGVTVVGTGTAWLVSQFNFWGRNKLQWLLILPMAMPAYIIAYTYTGMLDSSGPVQGFVRETFELSYGDYWFPEVRSLTGAIVMMTLVLYPYVYMLTLNAFREQSQSLYESSKSMGISGWGYFVRVALPLARPAIVTGASLAMMEALADYGTVQYFGVNTFTTGIFRTWFGMGNQAAAAQLASILCTFVFILILLESFSRRKRQYFHSGIGQRTVTRRKLSKKHQYWVMGLCFVPFLLGFIMPFFQLLYWSISHWRENFDDAFIELAYHSFLLAASAALVVTLIALLFSYSKRLLPKKDILTATRVASMGYAIPGAVVAVGVMMPLIWFDIQFDGVMQSLFGVSTGLLLSGSLFALVFAYSIRFLAVAIQNSDGGLSRIKPSMDASAKTMGLNLRQVLLKIHVPMLKGSLLSAFILVFVDVLKELPATLILRPFNFNTLAVRAHELASDERLVDAALPAIAIVIVGLIPIILLARKMDESHS
jgi:iron(III) transport system permease protein